MSKKNIEAIYPLSAPQQGMLFETLIAPESGMHIEQLSCALRGSLDAIAFEKAWQRAIDRHSILRTCFAWKEQDRPLQIVIQQVPVPFERLDWRSLSLSEQQVQLEAFLEADRQSGFQLSKPPLMRLTLIQLAEAEHLLIWSHHHILLDGWSLPLIFKEVLAFYQAFRTSENIHLEQPRPYKDYIAWLKQQDLSKAERFWRQTLQGFSKPTPLGITQIAQENNRTGEDFSSCDRGKQRAYLSASDTATLQSLVKANRLTLNSLVQGIWALLLHRYSGENDVVFGTTVSGRPPDLIGCESTIGLFTNTLPVRVKVSPQASLWSWLKDIQTYNFELRQYEHTPGGQVHQLSELPGCLPIYESIVVFENYPVDIDLGQLSDLKVEILDRRFRGTQTKYALILQVKADAQLRFQLIYDVRRLDSSSITHILQHFQTLLQSIIAQPELKLATLLNKITYAEIPIIKTFESSSASTFQLPYTPIEEVVTGIWNQLLGVERVGMNDNFFELGGHSLLATQILSRLRDTFQVEIPLRYLFESPTVAGLAKQIEIAMKGQQSLEFSPIERVSQRIELPLSLAQERLWFLYQLEPENPAYNIPGVVRLEGLLNIKALEKSLQEIVRRHEALRTNFVMTEGRSLQVIHPNLELKLSIKEVEAAKVKNILLEKYQKTFNLEKDQLLRITLLRMSEKEHFLLLTIHHIIFDGWSVGVLVREIATLYEAFSSEKPSPLPELPIQYADFAVWQRQWLQSEALKTQLGYWQQQLSGNVPVLQLPTDRPRPAVPTFQGATYSFAIPASLSSELKMLSRQESVTLFMTLLAAFQTLLHRYTGQEDILVGTDVANRNRSETEQLIGFFVNILVLRTHLAGNPTFRELLTRVRQVTLGAYAHQDLPFAKLVEILRPERQTSHTPLFQVLFVLQNAPMPPLELPGLTLTLLEVDNKTAKFDLALFLTETDEGIQGTWNYSTDIFEATTIARITGNFQTLLNNIVTQPDARLSNLEILAEAEKKQQEMEKQERKNSKLKKFMKVAPKAVSFLQESLVKTEYLPSSEMLPLVIKPEVLDINIIDWVKNNPEFIESKLLHHGALLFRGFNLNSVAGFENFAGAICPELFGEYGDLPREGVGGKVYGSTPYPSDKAILFHSESSHLHCWPMKIWFFCVQPAQKGGETPIVDCRKIYQMLDPKLRSHFEKKQLMYVRNYTEGLDVSWQEFFHTNDRKVVEEACKKAKTEFEWKDGNNLRTRRIAQAIAKHPKTGDAVFFNQILLHHISCLDAAVRESLLSLFGEDNLPRNVYYGDGSPIEDSVMAEIQAIYREATISFPWQQGDVLMLDNMLAAHSRNPYVGPRKIVVAMGEMFDSKDLVNKEMEGVYAN
ncbi:condensation domain-containing protein [Aerosakkonema funiforme]|uniref:condensation domain-containing protein n=1 Tax=Aerosakkonema funiforme TaxID=1246630 RepID=UPI0035B908E4